MPGNFSFLKGLNLLHLKNFNIYKYPVPTKHYANILCIILFMWLTFSSLKSWNIFLMLSNNYYR